MKFFEHWMEFISSASGVSPNSNSYFYKMRYPNQYKCDFTKVVKFNRDYKTELEYSFIGLFPIAMGSVSVSYETSSVMTVSVTFNYERYVPGKVLSIDEKRLISNNLSGNEDVSAKSDSPLSDDDLYRRVQNNLRVGIDNTNTLNPNLTGNNALGTSETPASSQASYGSQSNISSDWFSAS